MSASPWLAGFRAAADVLARFPRMGPARFALLYAEMCGDRSAFAEGYRAGMRSALGR